MSTDQREKPLHEQAAEVRAHIIDRDYGLAEKKAEIMCESLRKGDWTLGGRSSGVHRATTRSELTVFATEMETVLRENDHKSGWKDMSIDDIFYRIKDEFEELDEAHAMYSHPLISDGERLSAIQDMRKEAIDMANFCMFLCHNYPKV